MLWSQYLRGFRHTNYIHPVALRLGIFHWRAARGHIERCTVFALWSDRSLARCLDVNSQETPDPGLGSCAIPGDVGYLVCQRVVRTSTTGIICGGCVHCDQHFLTDRGRVFAFLSSQAFLCLSARSSSSAYWVFCTLAASG